jgi:hypothetical protein
MARKHRKYLEVIVQRDDIGMRLGYLLEDGNLVPDLGMIRLVAQHRETNLPCVLCPP